MKKFFITLTIFIISAAGFAQSVVINDPLAESRSVSAFSAIRVSGGITVYVTQGESEAIAVSAEDVQTRNGIRTTVENGVLKISYHREGRRWGVTGKKLKAYVSFKTLKQLYASGASRVIGEGQLAGDSLFINLSGASDIKATMNLRALSLDQSGASDALVTGKVQDLYIHANGASVVKGNGLEAETCTVKASGASTIGISVNKELIAHASGASTIHYYGSAVITDVKTSGASKINKRKARV